MFSHYLLCSFQVLEDKTAADRVEGKKPTSKSYETETCLSWKILSIIYFSINHRRVLKNTYKLAKDLKILVVSV